MMNNKLAARQEIVGRIKKKLLSYVIFRREIIADKIVIQLSF